jgi:hypothetical protein
MRLAIWTHWDGRGWEGEIPTDTFGTDVAQADSPTRLEYVFRWFNRVDEGDHQRMASVGYLLPSLSVGDRVTLDANVWAIKPVGFEPVIK